MMWHKGIGAQMKSCMHSSTWRELKALERVHVVVICTTIERAQSEVVH